MSITFHTTWKQGSYENDRNDQIKNEENPRLAQLLDLSGLNAHSDGVEYFFGVPVPLVLLTNSKRSLSVNSICLSALFIFHITACL